MSAEPSQLADLRFGVRCAIVVTAVMNTLVLLAVAWTYEWGAKGFDTTSMLIPNIMMICLGLLIWLRYGPLSGWEPRP